MEDRSLLKNKDYLILFSGQTISDLGSSVSQLAYPLLLLFLTNSVSKAGIGLALTTLPALLFGFISGAVADRVDRKKVMIICDIIRAISMGGIVMAFLAGHLSVALLYITAFINGTCDIFFAISEQSALPQVVGKKNLTQAFSQNELSSSFASLLGPAIGGMLYQIGKAIPFLADCISYVVSFISLMFIQTTFQEQRSVSSKHFLKDIKEGCLFVVQHPFIRVISFVRAAGALVSGVEMLLVIVIAKNLGANASEIGLILSVRAVGTIFGAALTRKMQKQFGMLKTAYGTRWLITLSFFFYIFANNVFILAALTAIYYFVITSYGIVSTSYRVNVVPDNYQGRVNSVHRMITLGCLTLGNVSVGFLIQFFGIPNTILLCVGMLLILSVLLTASFYKQKDPALS